jgi:hypothetical protein
MQANATANFMAVFLAILVLALFFIVFWCALGFLISLMTGWLSLGRRFRRQSEPYGESKSAGPFFYIVSMGWFGYSNTVQLTAASDALYASVLFPFRGGHPPLRMPWEEIRFGWTKIFFKTYVVLTLGNQEKIPMRISLRMARNLGILDRCPE